jgi:hypothetical protein
MLDKDVNRFKKALYKLAAAEESSVVNEINKKDKGSVFNNFERNKNNGYIQPKTSFKEQLELIKAKLGLIAK